MKNNKLTKAREQKKWTLTELSREAKVAWRTVDKAEKGQKISRICQVKIAAALDLAADDLF